MYIFLAVGVIHDHLPPSIVQDCSIENKRHAHQSRRWKKGPPPPRSTRPTSPSLARWSRSRARCRSRRSTRRAARSGGAERAPAPQRRAPPPPRGSSEERSIKRTHRVKAWGVLFSVEATCFLGSTFEGGNDSWGWFQMSGSNVQLVCHNAIKRDVCHVEDMSGVLLPYCLGPPLDHLNTPTPHKTRLHSW